MIIMHRIKGKQLSGLALLVKEKELDIECILYTIR
jgi:hypothetical protein